VFSLKANGYIEEIVGQSFARKNIGNFYTNIAAGNLITRN